MSKAPKIVQLIAATIDLHVVWMEAPNGVRMVRPVLALALLEDGSIRSVSLQNAKDDNRCRLTLDKADTLLSQGYI